MTPPACAWEPTGLIEYLTPETVTAIGVSVGALLGGLSALIKELRRPRTQPPPSDRENEAGDEALSAMMEDEFRHLGRTIWMVEQRLSERLQRIERQLGQRATASDPSE